jgi:hypothetical protein
VLHPPAELAEGELVPGQQQAHQIRERAAAGEHTVATGKAELVGEPPHDVLLDYRRRRRLVERVERLVERAEQDFTG